MLIFAPGFSTAEQVTDVSGRGVGMDVVKRNIQEMGGHVEIQSKQGTGTTIRILLPLGRWPSSTACPYALRMKFSFCR
ncbi:chemotaxis protein CheA [Escherichia coli]|uniref:histidine kinase n=1 Tax=Escherichia coli TaxID=562 RepID=A0A376KS83_ECOLX|nr:chemotaxis protein CheA [Escherichia coli]